MSFVCYFNQIVPVDETSEFCVKSETVDQKKATNDNNNYKNAYVIIAISFFPLRANHSDKVWECIGKKMDSNYMLSHLCFTRLKYVVVLISSVSVSLNSQFKDKNRFLFRVSSAKLYTHIVCVCCIPCDFMCFHFKTHLQTQIKYTVKVVHAI